MNAVQPALESLTILIAEDSAADRMLLSSIVRRQGHQVLTAANGAEAVEVFRLQCPQLVLMDAMMPVMDGFEAARQIKALATDDELKALQVELIAQPEKGDLIQGTGGLRKVRMATGQEWQCPGDLLSGHRRGDLSGAGLRQKREREPDGRRESGIKKADATPQGGTP